MQLLQWSDRTSLRLFAARKSNLGSVTQKIAGPFFVPVTKLKIETKAAQTGAGLQP
jgi:hypothetical protein